MAPPGVAIEIHGMADTSSRMNLKKLMEQFGEVIGCHIGNRGVDKPVVRFPTQECGDTALAALKNNQVWLDGVILSGDWQKSAPAPEPEAALMTSRDLLSSRRGGGKGGGRSRSRGGGGGGGSRDLMNRGGGRDDRDKDRRRRERSRSRRRRRSRSR
mmetsp:Transcript_89335/g.288837  ORF Transcript_89335/g.288837 Transcript_89335/m.288837 type:complete len:157 (-) Transcript_89335:184-654(-)